MEKQDIRERVWNELEASGEARFPYPPHGRIPNFAGADVAVDRLAETDAWQTAAVLKVNPDSPQLPVRRRALRDGKTVYVAVPRLRDEACFIVLDPDELDNTVYDDATTVGGAPRYGTQLGPDALDPIDLIVSGSVAVTETGDRIGKGEGYSDLEYAILSESDLVESDTVIATTVHDRQIRSESIRSSAHDVPIDLIVTPERVIHVENRTRPAGIDWDRLDSDQVTEIPILERLHPDCN